MSKSKILEDGYFIIENFFDPSNIMSTVQQNINKLFLLKGNLTTRYLNAFGADPIFLDLLLNTNILNIAHEILGECINLSDYQILTLHPGAPSINPHIDYPYLLMDTIFYNPIALLQTLWVLDDFTEINGATRIVPKSHKECKWADSSFEEKSAKLILKKGSLVVFHGALWHDTSPNISNNERSSLLISFCPPWIKPLNPVDKNLNKFDLPNEIKELLGFNNIKFIKDNLKEKQNQIYLK